MTFEHLSRALGALLIAVATSALAHGYTRGDLTIAHPYAVPTPPGATTASGYLKDVVNRARVDDRLLGATSPAAERVEMHTMRMDGDVMRMRSVPSIVIPAGGHVAITAADGMHLMLVGIKAPLKVGDVVPLTLRFEHAGNVDVELHVQARDAQGGGAMHTH